jgi:hypothetical protein
MEQDALFSIHSYTQCRLVEASFADFSPRSENRTGGFRTLRSKRNLGIRERGGARKRAPAKAGIPVDPWSVGGATETNKKIRGGY